MPLVCIRRARELVGNRLALLAAALVAVALSVTPARAVDLLDGNEDFTLLAKLGFEEAIDGPHADGSRKNDYAWSMAWFNGKLLVGTGQFEIDPATGRPGGGQIWAYTPGGADGKSGTWKKVYEAPFSAISGGPREIGYRWMTPCTFRGTNYLFVSTLGVAQGNILYTADGVTFNTTSRSGMPNPAIGYRTMVCFTEQSGKTTLVTTPVGQFGFDASTFDSDRTDNPIALANDDPANGGAWRNYSPLRMNDPDNNSFFAMTAWNGALYAGVSNEVTGAQVWRTSGCQGVRLQCVPQWTKLIDKGGGRPPPQPGVVGNKGFSDMIGFNGSLYLAVSSPALDGDRIRAWAEETVIEPAEVAHLALMLCSHEARGIHGQSIYVDPFFGGGLLHEDEVFERILQATGKDLPKTAEHLARAAPRQWLGRMLNNLQAVFASTGRERDVYAMQEMQGLL